MEFAHPKLFPDPEDAEVHPAFMTDPQGKNRKWVLDSQEKYHGEYRIPTPYGSKLFVPRKFVYDSLPGFIQQLNPGMGLLHLRKYKHSIYDIDFRGYMRLPIELGGHVVKLGIFVKRTPNGDQYLSIKCIDRASVREEKLNKRTEELLIELLEKDMMINFPGIESFDFEKYGMEGGGEAVEEVSGTEIEGFNDTKW